MNEENIEKIEEIETLREATFALKPEVRERLLGNTNEGMSMGHITGIKGFKGDAFTFVLFLLAGLVWLVVNDIRTDNVWLFKQLSGRDTLLRLVSLVIGGLIYATCLFRERKSLLPVAYSIFAVPFLGALGTIPFSTAMIGPEVMLGRSWLLGSAVAIATLILGAKQNLATTLALMASACAAVLLFEPSPERAFLGMGMGFILTYIASPSRLSDSILSFVGGLLVIGTALLSNSPFQSSMAILLLSIMGLVLFLVPSKATKLATLNSEATPSIFAVLLVLCGVTAANQLLPKMGGMVVVFLMTLGLPLFSRALALRLLPFALMLALYKLLPNGNRLGSLTDQYALFGIVLGAALPIGLMQIQEKLGNKWVGLLALVLLIGFAPFTLTLLFGTKCLLALHIGLALGVAYRAVHKANADLSVLVAFGISLVAITFAPQWSEWVAEFTRADRLKWLLGIALGVGVLVGYSERKSR
jgi:hypothetical protein